MSHYPHGEGVEMGFENAGANRDIGASGLKLISGSGENRGK